MHTQCTRNAHAMHTQYTRNTHAMHTQCTRNAHAMHTQCTRNTHAIHTQYTRNTHAIHTQYTRSTHAAHTQHTRSTITYFLLIQTCHVDGNNQSTMVHQAQSNLMSPSIKSMFHYFVSSSLPPFLPFLFPASFSPLFLLSPPISPFLPLPFFLSFSLFSAPFLSFYPFFFPFSFPFSLLYGGYSFNTLSTSFLLAFAAIATFSQIS
jgi:hypothetical protein